MRTQDKNALETTANVLCLSRHFSRTVVEPHINPSVAAGTSWKGSSPRLPDVPQCAVRQPARGTHCRSTVLDHPPQLVRGHQVSIPAPAGKASCLQFQALRAILRLQHKELPCVGTNTNRLTPGSMGI